MSCHLVRCDCLCCVMSRLLLQYGSALQRTNAALLCTTKYHSSTTLYYKVLQRTTPVLQSTTPLLRILQILQYNSVLQKTRVLQNYSVVQSSTHDWSLTHNMKRHLQCAEHQESSSNFTKLLRLPRRRISWLIRLTHETSFTTRETTGVIVSLHHILRLPRKMNRISDPPHTWNVICNQRSK